MQKVYKVKKAKVKRALKIKRIKIKALKNIILQKKQGQKEIKMIALKRQKQKVKLN